MTKTYYWILGSMMLFVWVIMPIIHGMNTPPVNLGPMWFEKDGSCVAMNNYDGKVPADMVAECDAQYRKAMTDYGLGDYIQK